LEDGTAGLKPFYASISETVAQGKLSIETVREAVKPLFYTRMRLGLFDPESMNPFAQLDPAAVVQSAEHRQMSLEAAQRSYVLLKNDNHFLPFKTGRKFGKIAVSTHACGVYILRFVTVDQCFFGNDSQYIG
jgi:beta-glucosidase